MDFQKVNWIDRAECQDGAVDFHSDDPEEIDLALYLCAQCPVRDSCLMWALNNDEYQGVWGGVEPLDLRQALSVSEDGKFRSYGTRVRCARCQTSKHTSRRRSDNARRDLISCSKCGNTWETHTSGKFAKSK